MSNSFLVFEYAFWWILAVVVIAAIFAFLPYYRVKYPWKWTFSLVLATLRFVAALILLFLLLNPLLRQVINRVENPKLAILYDNSGSVAMMTDSVSLEGFNQALQQTLDDLSAEGLGLDVQTLTTTSDITNIDFEAEKTDLSSSLKGLMEEYEGQNLAGIVLISDGIFNRGISPSYLTYPRPVITIGLGDTIPPKDLSIQSVRVNAIAYQGNKFPVEVIIDDEGFTGRVKRLQISKAGKVVQSQELTDESKILFDIVADTPGLNRYTVSVSRFEEETSFENNRSDFYVDVVEGKERILIVAPAPHPDLSAIRKSLATSDNYESEVFISGVSKKLPTGDYDVVIEHQAFARNFPRLELTGSPARWYILSRRSQIPSVGGATGVTITTNGNQKDNVTASFNPVFSAFQLNQEKVKSFSNFTPIAVPFGDYAISGPVQTLIYQQVGSVVTNRPLLSVFNDGNRKAALLAGDGFWKWRLLENIENGTNESFDELINKLIQYLSVKADKRRFRFQPVKSEFSGGETIKFSSELYNEIFEPVYGYKVDLRLTGEDRKVNAFEYFPAEGDAGLEIGTLQEGVYQFTARVSEGGNTFSSSGDFVVKNTNLESLRLTADHQLLKEVSASSGGQFIHFTAIEDLEKAVAGLQAKSLIRSNESFFPLIQSWWLLVFVFTLFSLEWFLRKFYGAY